MLALFYVYFTTIIWKALGVALLMNGVVNLVGRFRQQPLEVPKRIVFWVSIVIVFLAGFQAWREEHLKLLDALGTGTANNSAEVTALRNEVERLKVQRGNPRWIPDDRKAGIIKNLAAWEKEPGQNLHEFSVDIIHCGTSECADYAQDFVDIFTTASGWSVTYVGTENLTPPLPANGKVILRGGTLTVPALETILSVWGEVPTVPDEKADWQHPSAIQILIGPNPQLRGRQ